MNEANQFREIRPSVLRIRTYGKTGLATLAAVSGLALVAAMPSALAAPGDLLATVNEPEPMVSCCGIGIDYDGSKILYTHYTDPKVHFTDLSGADLGDVSLINPDGTPFTGDTPNAIAYNFSDGMLYAGGWSSTNLYKIDLGTGVTTLVKANALAGYESFGFVDGLAWDPTDNTFWMSDDVSCKVRHLDVSGNDLGGFDACSDLGLPGNSGLAVSLNGILWYGTNGVGDIYSLDTSTSPPTVLGTFAHVAGRDEDMVCGPKHTKADGTVVETLLSQDAYGNWFAVFEVADGECTSPAEAMGRMTGGGSVFTSAGQRVTHGFELHCDANRQPNNLEVNWSGNRFHLEALTSAACSDDPAIDEAPPVAGFDTYKGKGTGRHNGVSGATAEWTFTDAGEPGRNDLATLKIWDVNGNPVLSVSGLLKRGNHQAHQR